jgi:capsular polysaccharide transport system permease protein
MLPHMSNSSFAINDFLQGLVTQARCIYALVIRDMMMRYGRGNVGFLWVILEPMILTVGVMGIWSLIKPPSEHGIQIVAIVLTGYMPLTLWRHCTNSAVFLFRRNIGLLYHRNISLLDTFISRMILEFTGATAALATVSTLLVAAGIIAPPHDLGVVIAAWALQGGLSFGPALIIATLTEYSEVSERFIQPFQYLMLPLSGTFFMIEWLPTFAQNVIWYNPSVHIYEMFRDGFLGAEVKTHYNVWYPALWSLCLTAVGFLGVDKIRDRIHFG